MQIDLHNNSMTLNEIASIIGVTKERLRQIEKIALKKIKNPKISAKLRKYMDM